MGTTQTLSIPADEKLHEALQARALLQGKTIPDLVQEILSEALQERPLEERIGHLRGQLDPQQDRRAPSTGLFVSTDLDLGEESELFRNLER